jgi:hypothetical protein
MSKSPQCDAPSSLFLQLGTAAALTMLVCAGPEPAYSQTVPPLDPSPTCSVPSSTFATWFQSGLPSLNGMVNPANSVAFPNTPNCSFYVWAKQMFLWLTSPVGGGLIIDSPTFYDVSPLANGERTLIPHVAGFIRPFSVRAQRIWLP